MTGPTLPPVTDPSAWAAQAMWWSERYRSRALLWPAGADWFSNDPLGPMPHTHPGASEVFFVCSGAMQLTVGRTDLRMEAGDYCLVPPDTYHEPLNVGTTDLCVLVVVAPNWRHERWKPSDFTDDDFAGAATVVSTSAPTGLPSDERIESEVVEVPGGARRSFQRDDADHLLYVLDGTPRVTVEHLSGSLAVHQYANTMAGVPHEVDNHNVDNADGPSARLLSVWTPAPTGHGGGGEVSPE